jgi:RNA polymerase sigma-70 factor (ECF subfamily)
MNPSQALEEMTDAEVIARILDGETDLYEILVHRYNSYLYKVGRSYRYSHQDVEDLMQETYISAYAHLRTFENRSTFKTWIVRIMLNQCYHKKQRMGFRGEISVPEGIEEKSVPLFNQARTDTGKTVLNMELKEILESAVHHIPEDYRMVFTLRELSGMTVRETAEALDITEGNVKVRLNRAKQMLRSEIQKAYSPEEIFEFNLIYCDKMVERVMAAIHAMQAP